MRCSCVPSGSVGRMERKMSMAEPWPCGGRGAQSNGTSTASGCASWQRGQDGAEDVDGRAVALRREGSAEQWNKYGKWVCKLARVRLERKLSRSCGPAEGCTASTLVTTCRTEPEAAARRSGCTGGGPPAATCNGTLHAGCATVAATAEPAAAATPAMLHRHPQCGIPHRQASQAAGAQALQPPAPPAPPTLLCRPRKKRPSIMMSLRLDPAGRAGPDCSHPAAPAASAESAALPAPAPPVAPAAPTAPAAPACGLSVCQLKEACRLRCAWASLEPTSPTSVSLPAWRAAASSALSASNSSAGAGNGSTGGCSTVTRGAEPYRRIAASMWLCVALLYHLRCRRAGAQGV